MRLDVTAIRDRCRRRGTNISGLLRQAGVSRNAFYSLARRDSVVPRSLKAIADSLGVPVTRLLTDAGAPAARMQDLLRTAERIARSHPPADRDNIRHTLLLLDERPVERLRRALRRARTFDDKLPVLRLDRILASKKALGREKDRRVLGVLADALTATRQAAAPGDRRKGPGGRQP